MFKNIISTIFVFLIFTPLVLAAENKDVKPVAELLAELRGNYANVQDYSATMRLESFESEYRLQKQKMWFKKPGYLRLSQLGPFKKGAGLIIRPDGTIKGHLGGFLSFAKVSLDKDDENMYGVTNDSALNTDYDKILDIAVSMLDRVKTFSIATEMVNNKKQLVLDTTYDQKFDRYRLIVDPEKMLITGLERYSKGKLMHKIAWFNIQTNINISTEKFKF